MTRVGCKEIKPLVYVKFIETYKCIHTNAMLENELMYLY